MSNREEFIHKMQAKLEEWNAEIDTLTAKAGEVASDVKHEYHEQIESLKAKQTTARQKIEELQHSGGGAWVDLKTGIELAWTSMGEAIDSARSRFNTNKKEKTT
jgi:chromosome segregation ATPase